MAQNKNDYKDMFFRALYKQQQDYNKRVYGNFQIDDKIIVEEEDIPIRSRFEILDL